MRDFQSKQQNITFDGRTTEVVVRKKGGNKIQGPFSAVSALTNKKRNRGAMKEDVFDLLDQVSKGAFSVFNNLKYNRDENTNITSFYTTEELSKTDKEVLSRRLSELKKAGLIRSMKKQIPKENGYEAYLFKDPRRVFIINPIMIRCSNHDEAMYLWEQCDPKTKEESNAPGHPR